MVIDMLKRLDGVTEYLPFIHELNSDPDFRDPMLCSEEQMRHNLLEACDKPSNQIWGVFEGEELTGLFVFLVLEEEAYLEMLVGLSRSGKAYAEMLSFLKERYQGCQVDFVFNPGNSLLIELLREEGAEFYAEQKKLVLKREVSFAGSAQIELYSPKYREQYMGMHAEDGYWTADKVLEAQDRFRILLAIEDGEPAGYLDVTWPYEENEPYDLFVREESRGKGYGKAMLARAIELNRPKGMMVLLEADDAAAIALYEALGFSRFPAGDNITAQLTVHK